MGRIILGIVIGFAVWSVLWLGGGAGLQAAMPESFGPDGTTESASVLGILVVLSIVCSVASGLAAAAISKRGLKAGAILGVVLLAVGIAVQAGYWDRLPLWYHLLFLALLFPATLIGAAVVGGSPDRRPAL